MTATVTPTNKSKASTTKARSATSAPAKRAAKKSQGKRTEEWKQASRAGHAQAKAINEYLAMLDVPQTRLPSEKLLHKLQGEMQSEKGVKKILAIQRFNDARMRLLLATSGGPGREEIELAFIEHVKPYSEKKGITYGTWREAGVPARVLKAAGLAQARVG